MLNTYIQIKIVILFRKPGIWNMELRFKIQKFKLGTDLIQQSPQIRLKFPNP